MKILFDQGVPAPLRKCLLKHDVVTAHERGWGTMKNGDLLAAAALEFDLFLTTDKNLRYQQNISERIITIAVLPTTQWPVLAVHAGKIASQIDNARPSTYIEISVT